MRLKLAFDTATARNYDADGCLHISRSHISKATVNPYYGREIPHGADLNLEPNRVYYLLRDPEELRKAASTFERKPILAKHTPIDIYWDEVKRKQYIVGTIGSNVEFLDPYLDADVAIWDADAIAGIETDEVREFSCGYRYVPIMTTGTYDGQKYDGIMTQIQGNHLALVESGRAGSDVLAADSQLGDSMKRTKLGNALIVALGTSFPKLKDKLAEDSELGKLLATATRKTLDKPKASSLILAMDAELDGKQVNAVMDALSDVDDPEPTKKDNKEPEGAKDCSCGAKDGKHGKDCKMGKDSEEDDEDEEDEPKKPAKDKRAKDEKSVSKKDMEGAMDSLSTSLRTQFREADEAKRLVRPIVGDVIAMDSAAEIYTFALDQMKVEHTGVKDVTALRALFNLAKDRQENVSTPVMALDQATAVKRFPGLASISRG
jgi:hypothetical protein